MTGFLTLVSYITANYSTQTIVVMVAVVFGYVIRHLYKIIRDQDDRCQKERLEERKKCAKDIEALHLRLEDFIMKMATRDQRASEVAQGMVQRVRQTGPISDAVTKQKLG